MGALFKADVPPPPMPPANPPSASDPALALSEQATLRAARAANGAGFSNTITNSGGPKGLSVKPAQQATRSLLG